MNIKFFILSISFLLICHYCTAQQWQTNIPVHDPVLIQQDSLFYIFSTGIGISVWSSVNLKEWKKEKPVFEKVAQWAVDSIPGFKGHIWAPDISYHNGTFYLYYSVSTFGKNTSCIGVATNTTLHPQSPDFKWVDHGKLIQSIPGKTNWNAIDPNLSFDNKGIPYLAFGSFWDGIKLVKLKKDLLHIDEDISQIPTIASRKIKSALLNTPATGANAIEAPFIFKKKKYFYLFVSVDYCCKGINSNYKMMQARSKKIQGPYLDKNGVNMAEGGGSLLLVGDQNWYGVGHNAIVTIQGTDYIVYHGYDAGDKGKSKLQIKKLVWEKGWPMVSSE